MDAANETKPAPYPYRRNTRLAIYGRPSPRALALGEGLPMIGKLLGHTQAQTTARYAHLARDTVKASAARIGDSIDNDLVATP